MKKIRLIALCCAVTILGSVITGCGGTQPVVTTPSDAPVVTASDSGEERRPVEIAEYDGYELIWNDEFEEDELNRDKWNVEVRQPGATNQELQEYKNSPNNVYTENGALVLRALKTDRFGKDYYTSGKVNTRNRCDFP